MGSVVGEVQRQSFHRTQRSSQSAYLDTGSSLCVTFQPWRLAQSSWMLTLMPKSSSPTDPSTHGTIRARKHCCKREHTGCTGSCNIATGSLGSYIHSGRNTGNASLMTTSSRMEKRRCVHTTWRSESMRKRGSGRCWNSV